MTAFNGATGQQPVAAPPQGGFTPAVAETEPVIDTLAMLRNAVAEQVPIEDEVITAPGGVGIRLVCAPDISSRQLQTWQQRSLPKHLRDKSQVSPLAMDQMVLTVAALVSTLKRIEVRDPDDRELWHVITDQNGVPLGFNDTELLRQFGAMDTATALKKIFGRDSDIVRGGRQVLTAAGWGEDVMVGDADVDDSDPS